MGAALGAALAGAGHSVRWASEARSAETAARAAAAGLVDVGTAAEVVASSDMIISICPPHAAPEVAGALGAFTGIYLDANAVSPETARSICRVVVEGGGRFVDGGVIGPPPLRGGTTRLYLSGPDAIEASEAFATPLVETHVVSEWPGAASALKLAYAAWTKGTAALLLAIRAAATAENVDDWLLDEWRTSQPTLSERSAQAARSAVTKGWRWDGEMEEIAAMFAADGLPGGFHRAAAEIYRSIPRHTQPDAPTDALRHALDALVTGRDTPPAST
jgi:3-hydroxyisobutyrate dehydrogenase-like beta-hydroxyacid dehydrogenase